MNKSVINMAFAAFFGLRIELVAGRYNQTNDIGFVGQPMGNQKPVYAANGLPDNCRAIIKENVQYYRLVTLGVCLDRHQATQAKTAPRSA